MWHRLYLISFVFSFIVVRITGFNIPGDVLTRRLSNGLTKISMTAVIIEKDEQQTFDDYAKEIHSKIHAGGLPSKITKIVEDFYDDYASSSKSIEVSPKEFHDIWSTYIDELIVNFVRPYKFESYHKCVRKPFDYFKWGNEFMNNLIITTESRMVGSPNLDEIEKIISSGENVVILSNHQTEADPQVISYFFEKHGHADLGEKLTFVAGHKVTSDPFCIPFSKGRNLVCIHSTKYKNAATPEENARIQEQNLQSMQAMGSLFAGGGRVFWVAPSGGRDRPDPATGKYVVAPFASKVLDMFRILSMQSGKKMHFFPMAMFTHELIPPPETRSNGLFEKRTAKRARVSIDLLNNMEDLGGLKDKEYLAEVQEKVDNSYKALSDWHGEK